MSAEQSYLDKANEHIKLKEYEAVIVNLDKALEVNPKNKESYLSKGNALKSLDNKEAALAAFENAIGIDPRYKEAHFKKGIVLDDLGQKEAALAAFEKAIGIDPHYKEAHFKKGVVLDNLDLKEAALAAFEKAIEIDQHFEFAHYSKGLVLFDLDQKEAALAALEKAIEINPNDSSYFNLLGECLTELGKFKEAISAYDQAIILNPKDDLANENKGFALYHLGEIEEAIKCYDMQIEIVPEMWGPYLKKGKALQDLNKTAEALEYFQKGMDIINQGKLEGNIFFPLSGEDVTLNNLEMQLISGIKELLTLPILKVTQDEPEEVKTHIQGLNKKRDALKLKFINAVFSAKTKGSKQQQEEIDQLKKELEEVKNMYRRMSIEVAQVKADIQDSGMKELAEVKRGFKALEEQDPELLAYCKTFYWTTTNLFSAYRAISTGLIQVNFETEANQNEDLLVAGAQKATSLLAGVANGIPLVGGILSQLNTIIDGIYGAVKENRFNNKVAAINKIIQAKFGTEDDISLNVSRIALAITLAKKKAILFPEISSPSSATTSQKVKAGLEWLSSQVDQIKGQVLPSVELQDQESTGAMLALQDVVLFMAYLCKNSESVIKRKNMGLDQQIVSIIEYNGFEQLLEERVDAVNKVEVEINQEEKRSEGCNCTMF